MLNQSVTLCSLILSSIRCYYYRNTELCQTLRSLDLEDRLGNDIHGLRRFSIRLCTAWEGEFALCLACMLVGLLWVCCLHRCACDGSSHQVLTCGSRKRLRVLFAEWQQCGML